ncbi:MAG: S-layer homology domain-containing protein [Armatimonadetes bacterium]|nr:S-layer homology domain-containing protein [Armatimonadota bacterium]
MRKRAGLWLCSLLWMLLAVNGTSAQTFGDIAPDHPAYRAVEDLAAKGLVLGYPDGRFLGSRSLTRYEMAALVQRILAHLGRTPGTQGPPGPRGERGEPGAPGLSPEDAARIRQLVETFKVELAVMGADLKQAQERLGRLETDVKSLQSRTDTLGTDVRNLKNTRFSGYIQARSVWDQASRTGTAFTENFEVDPATGEIRKVVRPGAVTNRNTFFVRRARLKVVHAAGKSSALTLQLDAGEDRVSLRDAYIDLSHILLPGGQLTIGQFKSPFGFEIGQSSSDREFPERTAMVRALFPGERDRGIKFTAPVSRRLAFTAGIFNGVPTNDRTFTFQDNNTHKDWVLRLAGASRSVSAGVSGYIGKNAVQVAGAQSYRNVTKNRLGADIQWASGENALRGEYMAGKDAAIRSQGFYVQYNRLLGVRNTLAFRYDEWDPDKDKPYNKLRTLGVAWLYLFDPLTRLTFACEHPDTETAPGATDPRDDRFTFQVQRKF